MNVITNQDIILIHLFHLAKTTNSCMFSHSHSLSPHLLVTNKLSSLAHSSHLDALMRSECLDTWQPTDETLQPVASVVEKGESEIKNKERERERRGKEREKREKKERRERERGNDK